MRRRKCPQITQMKRMKAVDDCYLFFLGVGLALAMYHQTYKMYPMLRDRMDQYAVSWSFRLLPHLEQQAIFEQGTHFNPVDLVCGVRDCRGQQFDLSQFIDDNAVFLSKKSSEGRDLMALERPGLWNGAMAGWVTVFVEVPLDTFNPVKTVLDLLRPAHQPGQP